MRGVSVRAPANVEILRDTDPIVDEFIVGPEGQAPDALPPPPGGSTSASGLDARFGPAAELPPDAREKLRAWSERMAEIRRGASNNWAISPELTDTGRSMISGDPHQPLRSPSLFWLHHMNSADAGGAFDVIGWSFSGTPGISIGHNKNVAWTATTNYPDVTDIWDVAVNGNTVTVAEFYDNLTEDWVEGEFRLLRFKRDDVEAAVAETIVLEP